MTYDFTRYSFVLSPPARPTIRAQTFSTMKDALEWMSEHLRNGWHTHHFTGKLLDGKPWFSVQMLNVKFSAIIKHKITKSDNYKPMKNLLTDMAKMCDFKKGVSKDDIVDVLEKAYQIGYQQAVTDIDERAPEDVFPEEFGK